MCLDNRTILKSSVRLTCYSSKRNLNIYIYFHIILKFIWKKAEDLLSQEILSGKKSVEGETIDINSSSSEDNEDYFAEDYACCPS